MARDTSSAMSLTTFSSIPRQALAAPVRSSVAQEPGTPSNFGQQQGSQACGELSIAEEAQNQAHYNLLCWLHQKGDAPLTFVPLDS